MMAIVVLLGLASGLHADEYAPADWIRVTEDGEITVTFQNPVWGLLVQEDGWQLRREFDTAIWGGCVRLLETCGIGTTWEGGQTCGFANSEGGFVFTVTEDGRGCLLGAATFCSGTGLDVGGFKATGDQGVWTVETLPGTPLNNVTIGSSSWQKRSEGSAWTDVAGTERDGEICGGLLPDQAGEYRWVVEVEIDGEAGRFSSGNTVGDDDSGSPPTLVNAVSWGLLKWRAARTGDSSN